MVLSTSTLCAVTSAEPTLAEKKAAKAAVEAKKNLEKEIMTAKEAALARIAAKQGVIADHKQAIKDKKALEEKVKQASDAIAKKQLVLQKEQFALFKNNY
ncbi:hypothetical protein TrLO_g9278 [Triparma laevis f. longispina]|uniref:Uncharacterized protein n=1 Tax=Triparma laevis f. longispina TaxID=1714387 RepID=A0A9W7KYW3_9STRA|nr:hypothetical protein TrLO_g9278 [Triparma laevis f. longispina]